MVYDPDRNIFCHITESHQLTGDFIQKWCDLEENSVNPNFYLSVKFSLPAFKYLSGDSRIFIVTVEERFKSPDGKEGHRFVALGIFEDKSPSIRYPFRYLRCYQPKHAFISGFLIDKSADKNILEHMFEAIKEAPNNWQLIEFKCIPESVMNDHLSVYQHQQSDVIQWHSLGCKQRAILSPKSYGEIALQQYVSSKKKRDIRRQYKRLKEIGNVNWLCKKNHDIDEKDIESFLLLESQGWKKDTSLNCCDNERQFFLELLENTKKENLFLTELSIDNRVVASTCNFIYQDHGFGFKLGWDHNYSKYSVGCLNAYELVKNMPVEFPNMKFMDSATEEGSFIEKLWGESYKLHFGVIGLSGISNSYLQYRDSLSSRKRKVLKRLDRVVNSVGSVFIHK